MRGCYLSRIISTKVHHICCSRVIGLALSLALFSRDILLLLPRSPDSANEERASLLVIDHPFGLTGGQPRTPEVNTGLSPFLRNGLSQVRSCNLALTKETLTLSVKYLLFSLTKNYISYFSCASPRIYCASCFSSIYSSWNIHPVFSSIILAPLYSSVISLLVCMSVAIPRWQFFIPSWLSV